MLYEVITVVLEDTCDSRVSFLEKMLHKIISAAEIIRIDADRIGEIRIESVKKYNGDIALHEFLIQIEIRVRITSYNVCYTKLLRGCASSSYAAVNPAGPAPMMTTCVLFDCDMFAPYARWR